MAPRTAVLVVPEGERLARRLAGIGQQMPMRAAAE
jgi:hypothetical protein